MEDGEGDESMEVEDQSGGGEVMCEENEEKNRRIAFAGKTPPPTAPRWCMYEVEDTCNF